MSTRKYPASDKSKKQEPPKRKSGRGDTGSSKNKSTPGEMVSETAKQNTDDGQKA